MTGDEDENVDRLERREPPHSGINVFDSVWVTVELDESTPVTAGLNDRTKNQKVNSEKLHSAIGSAAIHSDGPSLFFCSADDAVLTCCLDRGPS
jgi:hypothetical protein